MRAILNPEQAELVGSERQVLRDLQGILTGCDASREDLAALEASLQQLDEIFLLVVVGEFNAGKSTFINALIGQKVLPEGVTPTTTRIHHLTYGGELTKEVGDGGIEEIQAPAEILQEVGIVDTPGTNALDRQHEAITAEFVPRADLVLFVTSADRPFTDSERVFMEGIRQWGKKLVLAVNKIDILRSEAEIAQVREFVVTSSRKVLGFEPEVFMLSAERALTAKLATPRSADADPGFAALETYLIDTLDQTERIRLKLANPLGVAQRFTGHYLDIADSRIELLADDFKTLKDIDRQLDLFEEDMAREFRFRLSDVDAILHEFEKRGADYFDETLRLARAIDLFNKAKIRADFERQVIADAPQRIEAKVSEIIDWMVASELRQWKAVGENLELRRGHHSERLVGSIGTFDYDRQKLLDTVGRAAHTTVDRFDRAAEANRLAESVQTAVASAALMEVGALGLGALVTALATTQLADVTGLLAAGTLALLGLLVLPVKRRRAKRELAAKIQILRDQLMGSMTAQFDREIDRSMHRIQEAIGPYTRFVRAEREQLEELRGSLAASQDAQIRLGEQINSLALGA